MVCPRCGCELPERSKFCFKCGFNLSDLPTRPVIAELTGEGYALLAQGRFVSAMRCFEALLREKPFNSGACIGKLLATLQFTSVDQLVNAPYPLNNHPLINMAMAYASPELKSYCADLVERNRVRLLSGEPLPPPLSVEPSTEQEPKANDYPSQRTASLEMIPVTPKECRSGEVDVTNRISVREFVGNNDGYYRAEFDRLEQGLGGKFNIAAFLFGPFFCLYRKCTALFKQFFLCYMILTLSLPVIFAIVFFLMGEMGSTNTLLPLAVIFLLSMCGVQIYGLVRHIQFGRQFNTCYYEQHVVASDAPVQSTSAGRALGGFAAYYLAVSVVIGVCVSLLAPAFLTSLLNAGSDIPSHTQSETAAPAEYAWMAGEWRVRMTSCLDGSGVPDAVSGTCEITITGSADGITYAVLSSNGNAALNGLVLIMLDDTMCVESADGRMYGRITQDSSTGGFTIDFDEMESPQGDELVLADYGLYATMEFATPIVSKYLSPEGNSEPSGWYDDSGEYESSSNGEDYFYPSDTQHITEYELDMLGEYSIDLIRNEIYARHGYIFQGQEWVDYFSAQWWYTPNPNFDISMFNTIESENIKTITAYEKEMGWRS